MARPIMTEPQRTLLMQVCGMGGANPNRWCALCTNNCGVEFEDMKQLQALGLVKLWIDDQTHYPGVVFWQATEAGLVEALCKAWLDFCSSDMAKQLALDGQGDPYHV